MKALIQRKIIDRVKALLKQGTTPGELAKSLSAGLVLAVFPVFGVTTGLCLLVASLFRLNHIAIQIGSYVAYPLQFLLFIPFLWFGQWWRLLVTVCFGGASLI